MGTSLAQISVGTSSTLNAGSSALTAATSVPANFDATVADQQANGEANAVSAMGGIVSKGSFDTSNPADQQAIVAIAAGACTALGFPEVGAAVELGFAAFEGLQSLGLFHSGYTCTPRAGAPYTTQEILTGWGYPWPGSHPPSPFGLIAIPMFAKYTADSMNCVAVPSAQVILEAVIALWNQQGRRTPTPVFVPGFFAAADYGSEDGIPLLMGSAANASSALLPYAFQPTSSVPQTIQAMTASAGGNSYPNASYSLNEGPTDVAASYGFAPIYTAPPSLNLATYALTAADTLDLAQYALTVPAAAPPAAPSIIKPLAWGAGLLAAFYAVHRWL